MAQAPDLDYILSDCFLAVGQAVGPGKGVSFDAVTWWHRRYRRAFHHAMTVRETSWAADRRRVTAVGRYLGQRVVEYADRRTTIDVAAAARASVVVEQGCQMNAAREVDLLGDGTNSAATTFVLSRHLDSPDAVTPGRQR